MNQFAKQSIKCFGRTSETNMQMQIVTLKLKFTNTWTFENNINTDKKVFLFAKEDFIKHESKGILPLQIPCSR